MEGGPALCRVRPGVAWSSHPGHAVYLPKVSNRPERFQADSETGPAKPRVLNGSVGWGLTLSDRLWAVPWCSPTLCTFAISSSGGVIACARAVARVKQRGVQRRWPA